MQSLLGGPRRCFLASLGVQLSTVPPAKQWETGDLAGLRWANSHVEGRDTWQDVYSPPQEVSRFHAALRGLQMPISSQLPAFKAKPGWRLFRPSHLGPSPSRRKILIDFSGMLAELWL